MSNNNEVKWNMKYASRLGLDLDVYTQPIKTKMQHPSLVVWNVYILYSHFCTHWWLNGPNNLQKQLDLPTWSGFHLEFQGALNSRFSFLRIRISEYSESNLLIIVCVTVQCWGVPAQDVLQFAIWDTLTVRWRDYDKVILCWVNPFRCSSKQKSNKHDSSVNNFT